MGAALLNCFLVWYCLRHSTPALREMLAASYHIIMKCVITEMLFRC